jgi:hypothetical protein
MSERTPNPKDLSVKRFICEDVEVRFARRPILEKRPGCPEAFTWQGISFPVAELLREWHDYQRRGRMRRNMRPEHAATAQRRGSLGVGRDYYRVRTAGGRIFDLCYDRAPKSALERKGGWFVLAELCPR